ncbi:NADH:ubiquinone oxidoreductase intermediate-associated protein 30 [Ochromonadaceae sp. CCMP2298]|nr:NADH:ubiquinone oxidoreductase intermediate-associated protein 30 [Ochromonadaceae sp. CCMP2298]
MGGVSKSTLEPGAPFDGTWTGVVSTANNGGFAGIRTKLFKTPFDLSSCAGVVIRLRGDGQRYKLILRDDADWNGIAWSHSLLTRPNKTVEYKIPFALFKPTKFARVLANFRPFDQTQLTGFQLSLSKFEYDGGLNGEFREGGFQLNVESIGTY